MTRRFVVAGTDTNVGKTVIAAGLAVALGAYYWKPIQSGLADATDTAEVLRLGVPAERVLPEAYRLARPLSPHRAAELDGVTIDPVRLAPPEVSPLVIELAGGLMVPVTRARLQIDVVAGWRLPVVLVARTGLGTINHTLLSLEALRSRGIAAHGVAFVGGADEDNERTIAEMGRVRRLGRLPLLALDADTLRGAFAAQFRIEDFA